MRGDMLCYSAGERGGGEERSRGGGRGGGAPVNGLRWYVCQNRLNSDAVSDVIDCRCSCVLRECKLFARIRTSTLHRVP